MSGKQSLKKKCKISRNFINISILSMSLLSLQSCSVWNLNSLFTWCSIALNLFIIIHFLALLLQFSTQLHNENEVEISISMSFLKCTINACIDRFLRIIHPINISFILVACMLHNALHCCCRWRYILEKNLSAKKMFILLLDCVCMNV